MPTVGQILDKLSKLKSRIAILEGVQHHLQANYLNSDAGAADMCFVRSDHGVVPQKHVEEFVGELSEMIEEAHSQLEEWEMLPIQQEDKQPPKLLAGLKKKKKRDDGSNASSGRQDPSTADVGESD